MNINWSRMAEPQDDGYDTQIALDLAKTEPFGPPFAPSEDAVTICDGQVAVDYIKHNRIPNTVPAPRDHPNIPRALDLVRRWPPVYAQFKAIMTVLHPLDLIQHPANGLGSSSHHEEHIFGSMYGTVYDPRGLAQACVHELAHNKLRALGVWLTQANRLILNDPNDLFVSPVVTTRKRPMTAVLHAQYSFIHITALDVICVQTESDRREQAIWLQFLKRNVPRMEQGYAEIERHIQVDAAGDAFITGFMAWSRRVLDRGAALLAEHGLKA